MIPFPIATPQGCNIQTFYGRLGTKNQTWNKPVGVSHVYIMLIGSGATGVGTDGGGSGAITIWYGAAQHVPDLLYIVVQSGGNGADTYVYFDTNQTYALLTANGGTGAQEGLIFAAGPFAASGFYQSVAGQAGAATSSTASATTFLSGGADANIDTVTANYGYGVGSVSGVNANGFFQMQPIIVGVAGTGTGKGGIGCGGGGGGTGGPGFALIASW